MSEARNPPVRAREPAVYARGLAVELAPGRRALDGVDLDLAPGEIVHLAGPSGSGKTTLLRALRGLVPLAAGELEVLGRRPERGFALAPEVAFVPQHLGLVRARSVLSNVLAGALARAPAWRAWSGLAARDELERARALLARLSIEHLAERPAGAISGGERQRAAIARAWMQAPRLVLADEFLAHLDPRTADVVLREVEAARARGVAFVATTHDPALVARLGGRVVALEMGRAAPAPEAAFRARLSAAHAAHAAAS
jgi:phosphonate transport system ATP-binding protein